MIANRTNRAASAADIASGTNEDAVVTYEPFGEGYTHILAQVIWSYSATPTGGRITVKDGSTVILDHDIFDAGPGHLPLDPSPYLITPGNALEVRLYAGGAGVVGKVTARSWTDIA